MRHSSSSTGSTARAASSPPVGPTLSPVVVESVASLHHGARFRLPADSNYIVSAAGGLQGSMLAASCSLALRTLRQNLPALGIALEVQAQGGVPFWAASGSDVEWTTSGFRRTFFGSHARQCQ
eukprot:1557188-Pyramimonas_sp.AAC.1